MTSIEKAFFENISKYIKPNDSVLVAFSGGCDSLALLKLCSKVLGSDRTYALYVNHNLRNKDELEREIELNKENCKKLNVTLEISTIENGKIEQLAKKRSRGIEEAARTLRYDELEKTRKKHNCALILTAHHKQDQIETMIMRLMRGSMLSSLCAISEISIERKLLRPLLSFSKDELEEYLRKSNLSWSTDSSNFEDKYLRNHIRNNIAPRLSNIIKDYDKMLLSLRDSAIFLTSNEELHLKEPKVALEVFKNALLEKKVQILYSMWDLLHFEEDLPLSLIKRVLKAIKEEKDCKISSNGAIFTIYHNYLYLISIKQRKEYENFEICFDPSKEQEIKLLDGYVLKSGNFTEDYLDSINLDSSLILRMDSSLFKGNVKIRYAKEEDVIKLKGGSKKVFRLLQDMKVCSDLRSSIPVLEDESGLCAVFCSIYASRDRICTKFITSLAPNAFTQYIVTKG